MGGDEALMQRVQRGDEAALGQLLERYRHRLFGFLVRRVDPTTADDVFQETWLRVVRYRDRFDPSRRFSTWLFQIANNLCRDRARRRGSEERAMESVRETQQVARELGRSPGAPSLDTRLDLQRRLAVLPNRLREVVLLRYLHALPEADVAEIVGIPRGTVKSRLHAAIRALRAAVETDDAV